MYKKGFICAVAVSLISCGSDLEDRANHDENIVKISGVYNTSRPSDNAYLYIAKNGEVNSFDYQADTVGTGDNCYSLATQSSQINFGLNGGLATYDEATAKYTITGGGNTLTFQYDSRVGMYNFVLDQGLQSSTGISIIAGNTNINVGGDGSKQIDNPSIDVIKSSICR